MLLICERTFITTRGAKEIFGLALEMKTDSRQQLSSPRKRAEHATGKSGTERRKKSSSFVRKRWTSSSVRSFEETLKTASGLCPLLLPGSIIGADVALLL